MIPREDVASDPAPAEGEFDLAKFEREFWEEYEESKRKSRPATDLGIYCDQHLGTEMVRSRSHGLAGEYDYGEPKADVWVTDYWRCQQNGCVRCYDASRGYFAYSRIMGSRIQLDTPGQKRCGEHPERPVMYVGKDGNGRRMFCPFYKCGERGEMIAEVVVDTPVQVPRAEPKASNQEMQWAEERQVLESFVTAAGLVINEGSIQCGQPPQPDIRCVCSGELRWFELGQIVNETLKEATDPKRSRGHGYSFSQAAPFVRLLDRKLARSKNYRSEGVAVDLLMWFDLTLGTAENLERLVSKHLDELDALLVQGFFDRVWVYDRWARRIIWSGVK